MNSRTIVAAALACYASAVSADIEILQTLDFGTVAIKSNNRIERYTISKEGNNNASSNIVIFSNGTRGLFRLFNLPSNQNVFITTTIADLTLRSPEFNTDQFNFESLESLTVFRTDANGEVIVPVGGTIATNGDGSINFGVSPLAGTFSFSVNY